LDEIEEITEDQWVEYLRRLTLHVARKFERHGWGSRAKGWGGPGGKDPLDIAQEVLLRVINGTRKYNAERYKDFLHFLCSAADSLISHQVSDLQRRNRPASLSQFSHDSDETPYGLKKAGRNLDPVQTCMNTEVRERIKAVVLKHFADDNIVIGIVDCLEAGIAKRSEIAEYLEIDVKEVDNAKGRLRRKLESELKL